MCMGNPDLKANNKHKQQQPITPLHRKSPLFPGVKSDVRHLQWPAVTHHYSHSHRCRMPFDKVTIYCIVNQSAFLSPPLYSNITKRSAVAAQWQLHKPCTCRSPAITAKLCPGPRPGVGNHVICNCFHCPTFFFLTACSVHSTDLLHVDDWNPKLLRKGSINPFDAVLERMSFTCFQCASVYVS